MSLTSIVESLLFASDTPLSEKRLCELTEASTDQVREVLAQLTAMYQNRGIELANVNNGWQFRTDPTNANWVKRLFAERPARLTRAMLETLAIIAYRQPITRPELEDIRGVDSASTLRVLLERNLIRILGKKEEPGRPVLYGTTKEFLEFFQLRDLKDLPSLKEFTELSEEHAQQVEIKFGEGAAEAALEQFHASRHLAVDETQPSEAMPPRVERPEIVEHARPVRSTDENGDDEIDLEAEEDAAFAALERAVSRADSALRGINVPVDAAPPLEEDGENFDDSLAAPN